MKNHRSFNGTGATPYYSPLFGRGGEAAVFSVEVTHLNGAPTLTVTVEHKDPDDTTFTTAGALQGEFAHVLIRAPRWLPC